MANVVRVSGFRPVRHLNGSPWNGQVTRYATVSTDATPIFIGDLVKISGQADANGVRAVTKASVGDAVVGAVVGIDINPLNLNTPQYRTANQVTYVYVADSPDTMFMVHVAGTIAPADVGLNANHADAGGSTTTGSSGESVDGSTKATTATLTLKIMDYVQAPDNDPNSADGQILVKINNHQLASGTGVVGV